MTTGHVFVGNVGAQHRCEYTEYGDKVNMAARYMSNSVNEVYTDMETFQKCAPIVDWDQLKPIKVKGKDIPVPVYRPFKELKGAELQEMMDERAAVKTEEGIVKSADGGSEFVGRLKEVHAITEVLNSLMAGDVDAMVYDEASGDERLRVVVVEAEAGFGKTRIIEEMRRRVLAVRPEASVLISRGSATETTAILYPWAEIFRFILNSMRPANYATQEPHEKELGDRTRLNDLLPPEHSEHASLLNSVLGLHLSQASNTLALNEDMKQEVVIDMLVHMLSIYSHRSPTVVVMEDTQHLDSWSWELLQAVVSRVTDGDQQGSADTSQPGYFPTGFAVVLSCQTTSGVLYPAQLKALTRLPAVTKVTLGPMPPNDLVRIAKKQLGARMLSKAAEKLLGTKSAGSPFFCLELVKLLKEQHMVITDAQGRVDIKDASSDKFVIPDSVEQAIVSRVDRLQRKYLMALKCASVAGNDFVDTMLLRMLPVMGIAAKDVPTIVQELLDMGILELCGSSKYYTHSFKSGLVKDVVYERLPFTQRRELHAAVARWIEDTYADDLGPFYPMLARHWQSALFDGEAVHYFRMCADVALRSYANHEAVNFLKECLTIVHSLTLEERIEVGMDPEQHAIMASQLGDALLRIGMVHEAMQAIELLFDIVVMTLPSGSIGRKRALLAMEVTWISLPLSTRKHLPLHHARVAGLSNAMIELSAYGYQMASRAYYFAGDLVSHDIVALRGLDVASRPGVGVAQLCRSQAAAALAFGRTGKIKTAVSLLQQAAAGCKELPELADEEHNRRDQTQLYVTMMQGMLASNELCDWRQAQTAFQETMDVAQEVGILRRFEEAANQMSLVHFTRGRLDEADSLLLRASHSAEGRKDVQMYTTLTCLRASILLILGKHSALDTVLQDLERMHSRISAAGYGSINIQYHGCLAMARLQVLDDMEGAVESATTANDLIHEHIRTPAQFALFFAYAHIAAVEVEHLTRHPSPEVQKRAASVVGQFEAFATRFKAATPRFLLYRGVLAFLLGRETEAQRTWNAALRLANRLDLPYEEARVRWEMALRTQDSDLEDHARHDLEALGVNMRHGGFADMGIGGNAMAHTSLSRGRNMTASSSAQQSSSRRNAVQSRVSLILRSRTQTYGRASTETGGEIPNDERRLSYGDNFDTRTSDTLDWAKGTGPMGRKSRTSEVDAARDAAPEDENLPFWRRPQKRSMDLTKRSMDLTSAIAAWTLSGADKNAEKHTRKDSVVDHAPRIVLPALGGLGGGKHRNSSGEFEPHERRKLYSSKNAAGDSNDWARHLQDGLAGDEELKAVAEGSDSLALSGRRARPQLEETLQVMTIDGHSAEDEDTDVVEILSPPTIAGNAGALPGSLLPTPQMHLHPIQEASSTRSASLVSTLSQQPPHRGGMSRPMDGL